MNFKFKILNFKSEKGQLLLPTLIFIAVAIAVMGGVINWSRTTIQINRDLLTKEKAIQLAESGIDYYRWHLAHAQDDYQDGTGEEGPYVHQVFDKDNNLIGAFSLDITPPPIGSTKVIIESTGTPEGTEVSRTIKVEMAIPSLAKYAVAANDVMRFGEGTEIFGPVHSNQGIRFDGLTHNIITSALTSYDDPDHTGGNEFAVHTHISPVDPLPPAAVPSRPDVFEAGRQFPVPAIDFIGLTKNLADIKAAAQEAGRYFAPSGRQGYQIILRTDNTFDIYRVTSQQSPPSWLCRSSQTDWGTWSINNRQYVGNYDIPENGLIFIEDNLWVEGDINTARITIAAGRFPDNPSNRPQITVNNDLTYTNYDGSDVVALISQGNINVGLYSENDLRIDAALVSQNGRIGRYYYNSYCGSNYVRDSITLFGTVITNQRYGFAYADGTGYQNRFLNYDANLLYSPPPSFPLTSDQYEILSWEEI